MTTELAKAFDLTDEEFEGYLEYAGLNRKKFILAFAPEKTDYSEKEFSEEDFLIVLKKVEERYTDKDLLQLTDKKFKGNPGRYTIPQIIQILGEVLKQTHPQDIAPMAGLTAAQIKKIRFIFKRGNEFEKVLMLKCKWFLSSIKRSIRLRKLGEKKERKNAIKQIQQAGLPLLKMPKSTIQKVKIPPAKSPLELQQKSEKYQLEQERKELEERLKLIDNKLNVRKERLVRDKMRKQGKPIPPPRSNYKKPETEQIGQLNRPSPLENNSKSNLEIKISYPLKKENNNSIWGDD